MSPFSYNTDLNDNQNKTKLIMQETKPACHMFNNLSLPPLNYCHVWAVVTVVTQEHYTFFSRLWNEKIFYCLLVLFHCFQLR